MDREAIKTAWLTFLRIYLKTARFLYVPNLIIILPFSAIATTHEKRIYILHSELSQKKTEQLHREAESSTPLLKFLASALM